MDGRCPGARPLGPARLDGFLLRFCWDSPGWGGGVADVQPSTGDHVWGVLWDITDDDEVSLDAYEGVADGVYEKRTVTVAHEGGSSEAFLYTMTPDRAEKQPSGRYVNALMRGAKAYGIPEDYLDRLRALTEQARAARGMSPKPGR